MSDIPILELGDGSEPPKYEATMVQEQATNYDDTLQLSRLSKEEQEAVLSFKEKINLEDSNIVMNFGASSQKKIAQFSDSVLDTVRTKDLGEVGKSLSNLVVEIKNFDVTGEEKGGFAGFFSKKIYDPIQKIMNNYNKVEVNVDKIVHALETHQRTLMKDISVMDSMFENNAQYFKELTMYIIAGDEKLKEFRQKDIAAQKEKAENSKDEMETQKLNDMVNLANRFDKKLHDLRLSRAISMQMAPQIRLIQNNDVTLVEKIQSSLVNSIPLWKNQMVIALGLANSKAALSAQTKVTDMTNELLVKNSEMLKQGSIDIAKEAERSIVSIETIQKTNENLIATITDVLEIQEKGVQERAAAQVELTKIEADLRQAVFSAVHKHA